MGHSFLNFTTILNETIMHTPLNIREKAKKIKWLVSDCDGVLTDSGAYYSEAGVYMKRFSIRDGMGVERLRDLAGVDVAIMTGENTAALRARAKTLSITELYQQIKDKRTCLEQFVDKHGIDLSEVAFIGDDHNDLEVLEMAGLSSCPSDAMPAVADICDHICGMKGGHGAFRELAEIIIDSRRAIQ